MKSRLSVFILVLFSGIFLGQFASAETSENPCSNDIEKFCKDVEGGKAAIAKCLKENEKDLSAECKARIIEIRKKLKETQEACADDKEKFCKDVEGGRAAIAKCLKENEKDLSEGCKTKLEELRKK